MEKYDLPVRFTEEERKNYAKWGCKKEKVLVPFAIVTVAIDIIVVLATAVYLFAVREKEPYFLSWMSTWGTAVSTISYGIALFFTGLILKPLDMVLDKIYKKPNPPKSICLSPRKDGVLYTLTRNNQVIKSGIMQWNEWNTSVIFDTNEIYIDGEWLQIGSNTIETIYPKDKQHKWMDRPEEKIVNTISLKKISRNFEGFLDSLEEKKKEDEWARKSRFEKVMLVGK